MPASGSDMFGNAECFGVSPRPGEGDSPQGQTLVEHYNAHYGRYIDLADQLRTFGLEKEIPLPQVVVIGIQSSGKSSVLESISAVPLPRGTGTVTRTAVELRLHHTAAGGWTAKLTCENDAGEGHKVTLDSPAQVSDAIQTATVFLAGENGISDRTIIIDIWADNVPDLTLIDLPGLIEMPMEGQPPDICERIEALVLKYISKKEALILVVVAGNSEIATTKALRLAKTADPEGRRTIGVITKVDLVPRGTEQDIVRMVCEPAKYKIQKGFVLVKLRSKEDIDHQVTLQQNAENEARFFLSQTHYRSLPENTLGTSSLSNKLTWELVERIKTVLPSLKEETQKRMKDTEVELRMMGEGIPKESKEQRKYIAQKFLDFTKKLTRNCDGLYELDDANDMRLLLQTRPAMEAFAEAVNKLMPAANNEELVERVKEEIRNQRGEELPHFLPYRACQVVVSGLLKEYTVPAMKCLNDYNVIVDNFLRRLSEQYFAYFPRMENEIKLVIDELRTKAFDVCEAAIKDIFEIEYMVIIPDKLFFKMEANEPKCYSSLGSVEVDDRESTEKLIQFLMGEREPEANQPPIQDNGNNGSNFTIRQIIIYFKRLYRILEVRQSQTLIKQVVEMGSHVLPPDGAWSALDRITATVPMRIHYNLVRMLSRTIECQVTSMALDPDIVSLLMEDEVTAKRRGDLEGKLECLRRSYTELTRF